MKSQAAAFAVVISAATVVAQAGAPIAWDNPAGGVWNLASNWDPMTIPGASDAVFLGLKVPYTVLVSSNQAALSLTVANPSASLDIANTRTLSLFGPLNNAGVLTVNPAGGSATDLAFSTTAAITGDGVIALFGNTNPVTARITSAVGAVVTHGADHTIEGRGNITAEMVNNGTITADIASSTLLLNTSPKANNAVMQAVNGAVLGVSGITVTQGVNGAVTADGADSLLTLSGATIVGGVVESAGGGLVTVAGDSTLDAVELRGDAEVQNTRTLGIDAGTLNNGRIVVNPTGGSVTSLTWLSDFTLGGDGVVALIGSGNPVTARITAAAGVTQAALGTGQRLEGIGQIGAPLTIHGTLAPGLSVGTMGASQPVTLAPTTTFEAEVAAPDDADLLDSSSTFDAHGTLVVTLVDGYDPESYWVATIVAADQGVTGRFDELVAPTPDNPRLIVRVRYLAAEIRVGAVCKGDINFDAQLNFFDVSDFLALYNAHSPDADLNNDGLWNFFDVSAYLSHYNAGCP